MEDYHHGMYTTASATDSQAFYNATEDLRADLAANQAELNAIQASTNPDPARIKTLTRTIVKQQDQLRVQAEKYNMTGTDGTGYCPYSGYGHHGGGHMMGWN